MTPVRGVQSTTAGMASGDTIEQNRDDFYDRVRPQRVIFELAHLIMEDLVSGETGNDKNSKMSEASIARHQLFPELVDIVTRFVDTRVKYKEGTDVRELSHEIHVREVVNRIRDNILPAAAQTGRLLPVLNRFKKTLSTEDVNFQTTKPTVELTKSHLNRSPILSGYERAAIDVLEDSEVVEFYTPNSRNIGFTIPYKHDGEDKNYEPDFIVKLRNGLFLVTEIKGGGGKVFNPDAVPAKSAASKKWCEAVSNVGTFGKWAYAFCDANDEAELKQVLRQKIDEFGQGHTSVPYTIVSAKEGHPGKDCVPVISLRTISALPKSANAEDLFNGTLGCEFATWVNHPPFTEDMFVAKVFGDAMSPTIPANSYALFKRVSAGFNSDGKIVLVKDAAIRDKHSGGMWTVRRCIYKSGPNSQTGQMQHLYELKGENPESEPITITVEKQDGLDVRAEFVSLLRD